MRTCALFPIDKEPTAVVVTYLSSLLPPLIGVTTISGDASYNEVGIMIIFPSTYMYVFGQCKICRYNVALRYYTIEA